MVAMCTLQARRVPEKIRDDLRKVTVGAPVDRAYAFCEADIPASTRHELIGFAQWRYGIELEVFDGNMLAVQLAASDLINIASRHLSLPPDVLRGVGLEAAEAHEWSRRQIPGFPRPELYRYLQTVWRVAQLHPYAFATGLSGARMPPLTEIYMPQELVDLTGRGVDGPSPTGGPSASAWAGLLEHYGHLLVYGGPGAGKSSLLRYIAATAAADRLTNSPAGYFPVLMHARDLAADMPLADAIYGSAIKVLGTALSRGLPQAFFEAAPLPGIPWLVLVDGLDEIRDPEARAAAVGALAGCSSEPAWRFVVATRRLPDGDISALRDLFGECELRPFTKDVFLQFAIRWISCLADPNSRERADGIQEHVRQLLDQNHLPRTPLAAAMLTTLVADAPSAHLPADRVSLYAQLTDLLQARTSPVPEPGLRSLQEQCLTMLEDIAYRRHVEGSEDTLADLALEWAGRHGLRPAAGKGIWWARTVHDALCDTGLAVSASGILQFSHSTFEDFLAARHAHRMLSQQAGSRRWQETLSNYTDEIAFRYGTIENFVSFSQFLQFLIGMLSHAGCDVDAVVAEILENHPGADQIVTDFAADGLQLGEKVTAALTQISADCREGDTDRVNAAIALGSLDPDAGVALLLALTVDEDIDEECRLIVVRSLVGSEPKMAAAIQWLTFSAYWDSESRYSIEAFSEVTGLGLDDQDEQAGIEMIVLNSHLDLRYRVAADAELAQRRGRSAQLLLRSLIPAAVLIDHLAEQAEHGNDAAFTALVQLCEDDSLIASDRIDIAERLTELDQDTGIEAFNNLSAEPALTAEQRSSATARAADLRAS